MFRKVLLPTLAIAMLSGCVSGYAYRTGNGNGDYYYGQPQVEVRYIGGYGGYGGYGYGRYGYGYGLGYGYGFGYGYGSPVYYYGGYGRPIYGYSSGYYGAPYYSGGYRPYRPRPPHGGGQHHGHGPDDGNHGNDRPPPWRNIGGMRPGMQEGRVEAREDNRQRRQPAPSIQYVPRAESASSAPSVRSDGDGGSRMGTRSSGGGERARARSLRTSDD